MNLAEYLQPLPTELLIAMAKGEVDAQAIAAQLMAGRGLDEHGKWVFKRDRENKKALLKQGFFGFAAYITRR